MLDDLEVGAMTDQDMINILETLGYFQYELNADTIQQLSQYPCDLNAATEVQATYGHLSVPHLWDRLCDETKQACIREYLRHYIFYNGYDANHNTREFRKLTIANIDYIARKLTYLDTFDDYSMTQLLDTNPPAEWCYNPAPTRRSDGEYVRAHNYCVDFRRAHWMKHIANFINIIDQPSKITT